MRSFTRNFSNSGKLSWHFCAVTAILILALIYPRIEGRSLDLYDDLSNSGSALYDGMIDLLDTISPDIGVKGVRTPSNSADGQQGQQSIDLLEPGRRCRMPIRKGVCRALIPRWSYDSDARDCFEFKFGGCDGNANNFLTYKQCMQTCGAL